MSKAMMPIYCGHFDTIKCLDKSIGMSRCAPVRRSFTIKESKDNSIRRLLLHNCEIQIVLQVIEGAHKTLD